MAVLYMIWVRRTGRNSAYFDSSRRRREDAHRGDDGAVDAHHHRVVVGPLQELSRSRAPDHGRPGAETHGGVIGYMNFCQRFFFSRYPSRSDMITPLRCHLRHAPRAVASPSTTRIPVRRAVQPHPLATRRRAMTAAIRRPLPRRTWAPCLRLCSEGRAAARPVGRAAGTCPGRRCPDHVAQ